MQKQVAATSAAIRKFALLKFLQNPTSIIPAIFRNKKGKELGSIFAHTDHRKGKGIKFKMLSNPNN